MVPVGPKSFYQTNTEQAYHLYCVAREFANLTGDEPVSYTHLIEEILTITSVT